MLDGIRYAVEMADVAHERLHARLQAVAGRSSQLSTREIAEVMLDAWIIVDAVHRFVDLASNLPGLKHGSWLRLLKERTADALALRNDIQHLIERTNTLAIDGGQIWGYISWVTTDEKGRDTDMWLTISPGTSYVGDGWRVVAPKRLPFPVPPGRIRLNAFKREVYLGRCVSAVIEATTHIAGEIRNGRVRPVGSPAPIRGATDFMMGARIELMTSNRSIRSRRSRGGGEILGSLGAAPRPNEPRPAIGDVPRHNGEAQEDEQK